MTKWTVVLVACVLALGACSGEGDGDPEESVEAPQLSLSTVCMRLADQGSGTPVDQADYEDLRDRTAALADNANSEAAAAINPLADAYDQAASSPDIEALLTARQSVRDAFRRLQASCEAAGSPLS